MRRTALAMRENSKQRGLKISIKSNTTTALALLPHKIIRFAGMQLY